MTIDIDIAQRISAMRCHDLPADAVHWAKVAIIAPSPARSPVPRSRTAHR